MGTQGHFLFWSLPQTSFCAGTATRDAGFVWRTCECESLGRDSLRGGHHASSEHVARYCKLGRLRSLGHAMSCPLKHPESSFYPIKVEILMCRFWGATPEEPQSPSELGSNCGILNIESKAWSVFLPNAYLFSFMMFHVWLVSPMFSLSGWKVLFILDHLLSKIVYKCVIDQLLPHWLVNLEPVLRGSLLYWATFTGDLPVWCRVGYRPSLPREPFQGHSAATALKIIELFADFAHC